MAAKETVIHPSERIGVVTVRPSNKASSTIIQRGQQMTQAVLPGVRNMLTPVLDASRNFPGFPREDFKKLKQELDLPEKMTYEEFWTTHRIPQVILTDKPIKLNKAILTDYLKYLTLAHHPWVAKNPQSVEASHKYVIVDEEKEALNFVSKIEKKMTAMSLLNNMSMQERREMLFWAYGVMQALGLSDTVVTKEIMARVENEPSWFIDHYNKSYKDIRISLAKSVHYKVVNRTGSTYTFNEVVLGTGEDEAVVFLAAPLNSNLLLTIEKETVAAARRNLA